MTLPQRPLTRVPLAAAAACTALMLSACAFWPAGDAPPRTSISLSAPSSIQRPEWLQREVARMDAEAFPVDRLALKLSYVLSPPARVAAVPAPKARRPA